MDGKLAIGDSTGDVRVIEVVDDTLTNTTLFHADRAHSANVRGIALDDDLLISSSKDQNIWVRDLAQPDAPPTLLKGHTNEVGAVVLNPEATIVASAGNDGTIRIWPLAPDSSFSEPIRVALDCLDNATCFALDVAFSSDGTMLASTGSDGVVHVWDNLWDPDVACALAFGDSFFTSADLTDELAPDQVSRCQPGA